MLYAALAAALLAGEPAAVSAEPYDLFCTFGRGGKTYADRLSIDLAAGLWRHPMRSEAARPIAGVEQTQIVLRDDTETRKGLPDFHTREWVDLADNSYHYALTTSRRDTYGAMNFACKPAAFTPFTATQAPPLPLK
jgi:hypothetical protein